MSFEDRVDKPFESSLITIYDYRSDGAEPGLMLREEVFSDPCIIFPRRGIFLKHEGRTSVVGDPNHVLFFDAHTPFRISYPVGGGDDSTFLVLNESFLCDLLRAEDPRHTDRRGLRFPVSRTPSDPSLYLRHRAILRGCADGLALEESVVQLVGNAITTAFRVAGHDAQAVRPKTRRIHRNLVEALKEVLADRYRERLSLEDLARAVHSSPWHLSRLFKQETGIPIHRYRTRLRLRESLERILSERTSLTELALELGFSSHSHFTDAFRREFGLSPSRLRTAASLHLVSSFESRLAS